MLSLLYLSAMTRIQLGIMCGLIYGALSAASMLPLDFPDKRAAILGALLNRLGIAVAIGYAMSEGRKGWYVGLVLGILLSLPDAIITKSYAPILIFGALGGTLIGWIVENFAQEAGS